MVRWFINQLIPLAQLCTLFDSQRAVSLRWLHVNSLFSPWNACCFPSQIPSTSTTWKRKFPHVSMIIVLWFSKLKLRFSRQICQMSRFPIKSDPKETLSGAPWLGERKQFPPWFFFTPLHVFYPISHMFRVLLAYNFVPGGAPTVILQVL